LNPIYSRTAAALAAAAIAEVFPNSEFISGGETARGFFCQFISSYDLPPEALPMLEERMRLIVRENRPIQHMDMIAFCAKELLKKEGQLASAEALNEVDPKELVSLVRVGDFIELLEGPLCPSIRDVGAFQVVSMTHVDREYTIEGCAFQTKAELKEFVKKLSTYKKTNHLVVGQKLGLWEEGLIWREKGLILRRKLIALFKESLGGEEIAAGSRLKEFAASRKAPFWTIEEQNGEPEAGEGLFEEGCQSRVEQNIYCAPEPFLTSLLQMIEKTLIILGFHAEVCLAGRKARQWIVLDGLGREQIIVEMQVDEKSVCTKVRIEKILAVLLELTGGRFDVEKIKH
jgi:hypothetical protein